MAVGVIDEKDDDKEPPLVVVDEAEREAHEAKAAKAFKEDQDPDDSEEVEAGDTRLGRGRDDSEEEVAARGNETEEQRKERNRKNKRDKKARQIQAIERDRRERDFLLGRLEKVEKENVTLKRGQVTTQVMTVDGRIAQIEDQLRQANDLMAQAVDAQAGQDVVKITEIRDTLNGQLTQLKGYKEHLKGGGQVSGAEEEPNSRQAAPPRQTDPQIAARSQKFQGDLLWFDPKARDPDSAVVYAMDMALNKEGRFDPRGPKYWAELQRRVKAALPHKFEDADDLDDDDDDTPEPTPAKQRNAKGGGPRMPAGDRGGSSGGQTFYISKERKQALMDHGLWDDPKMRAKYVKKFKEWDEAHAPRQGR